MQRGAFKVTEDKTLNGQSAGSRGVVVAYVSDQQAHASEHERITQAEFARRLAALKDYEAGGLYEPRRPCPGRIYFVPGITLTRSQAAALGIRGPDDLFGGVVPHAFVATKVISHPLVRPDAAALPGWNPAFGAQVGERCWPAMPLSITTMRAEPAIGCSKAGRCASSRSAPPAAAASGGARRRLELQRQLEAIDPGEVVTHGAGARRKPERRPHHQRRPGEGRRSHGKLLRPAAPDAQQPGERGLRRLRPDRVRGDFDALLAQDVPPEIRGGDRAGAALQRGRRSLATPASLPRATTTTSSLGRDAAGRSRSGVLEQSWRLGGATGAEIAALEVFRDQPGRNRVRASAIEVFGESPPPPRTPPSISAASIRGPGA